MELRRVVITGIGTINSLGHNVQEYFDNLVAGKSGAGWITRFDAYCSKPVLPARLKITIPKNSVWTNGMPAETILSHNMLLLLR